MSFLEGTFLVGILAAAIPIIIHLLQRRRSRRVPFPSLRFLREVDARTARKSRIQEWLILALRVLALSFLALALARPALRSSSAATGVASRVLVLDNSLSMDSRRAGLSALERSLLVARGLLRRMGAADRTAVVPLHGDPLPPTESRAAVDKALASVGQTYLDSPILPILERSVRMLEADPNPVKEVYLFSDLQASAFRASDRSVSPPEGVTLILLEPEPDAGPNVTAASGDADQDRRRIRARLVGSRGECVVRARLSVDDRLVAERAVRVPDGGEARITFPLPELPAGFHRAEIRTEGDILPADDSIQIPLTLRGPTRVVIARDRAGGARDPAFYLVRALLAGRRSGAGLDVQVARTGELTESKLSQVQVVFLVEPAGIDASIGASLAAFVLRGGGLFISTGPRQEEGALEALATQGVKLAPVRLGGVIPMGGTPIRMTSWEDRHPIWEPLTSASPPFRPDAAAFVAVRKAAILEGAEALAKFSSGDPALVLRQAGDGKILFFASTLSDEWGNMPLRFIFAPWILSAVRHLTQGPPGPEQLTIGTHLVSRHPKESGFREARLEPPGGEPRRASAQEASRPGPGVLEADLEALTVPGVHVLTEDFGGSVRQRILVVERPVGESDLHPLGEERFRELFPNAGRIPFGSADEALARVFALKSGAEFRNQLLVALLLLLLVEPFLANRTAFRRGLPLDVRQRQELSAAVARESLAREPDSPRAGGWKRRGSRPRRVWRRKAKP